MIYVAIGGNLPPAWGGTVLQTCRAAAAAVGLLPGLQLAATAPWYESGALPPGEQPNYVNGMVALQGHAEPAALLAELHRIEADWGRARGRPDAARTLDLDIIDMHGLLRDGPDPVLPHPRAHLRAFVLLPLRDIAPDWRHPALDRGIGALIAALPDQPIRRLSGQELGG